MIGVSEQSGEIHLGVNNKYDGNGGKMRESEGK